MVRQSERLAPKGLRAMGGAPVVPCGRTPANPARRMRRAQRTLNRTTPGSFCAFRSKGRSGRHGGTAATSAAVLRPTFAGRDVPETTNGAPIGRRAMLPRCQESCIQRIRLALVSPFSRTHLVTFLSVWFFHAQRGQLRSDRQGAVSSAGQRSMNASWASRSGTCSCPSRVRNFSG